MQTAAPMPSMNPNMALFAQLAQQQGGGQGMPQMPPQGAGMPQNGGMPPGAGMMQPGGGMQPGMRPGMPMMPPGAGGGAPGAPQGPGNSRFSTQELAALGRFGDKLVAHLTPGEIAVPPQVQTPKLLATLDKAFEEKHVSPQQFTAGSPESSINPKSGIPEYNFLSAVLPAALGLGGSLIAPGIGTELGIGASDALMGAVGGGIGSAIGGVAAGDSPTQAALAGLGSGAGGYLLGSLGGGASGASASGAAGGAAGGAGNQVAASGASSANPFMQAGGGAPSLDSSALSAPAGANSVLSPTSAAASSNTPITPSWQNLWGTLPGNINPMSTIGSVAGGQLGSMLGAPPKATPAYTPPGFNTPMTPVSQLPSYQTLLGQNTFQGPTPNFTNYNPATNSPGAYNFFPVQS